MLALCKGCKDCLSSTLKPLAGQHRAAIMSLTSGGERRMKLKETSRDLALFSVRWILVYSHVSDWRGLLRLNAKCEEGMA